MKYKPYIIPAVLILFFVTAVCILCAVPPVARDALTQHLYVPKLYLRHGGIYEIPRIEFSYYPMNLEMLYLVALYLGSDILPAYIHFAFALMTAFLIFRYLKNRLNLCFALYGGMFFLSIPVIVKLSITAYVDLGLIFFTTFSLYWLFKWLENSFRLRYLVISAAGCGLALGTKYNGLLVLFLLTLFIPFAYGNGSAERRRRFFKPLGFSVVFFLISLSVYSPWMIRDVIWKHNPVYPLYNSWFNPAVPAAAIGAEAGRNSHDLDHMPFNQFLIRKYVYHESWWQTLLIPLRVFFEGQDDQPAHFDGRLSPLLFFLPFFGFLFIREKPEPVQFEMKLLLAFSVLYLLFAFALTDMRIRYIAPIIPPLVILSIIGLHDLWRWIQSSASQIRKSWGTAVICTGIIAFSALHISYLIRQFSIVQPLPYIRGDICRDAYITRYRPEFPAIEFINRHLPATAQILALWLGDRGYYFDRKVFFALRLPEAVLDRSDSPESVALALHRMGISCILVRYDLMNDWLSRQPDTHDKMMLMSFFQHNTRLIFSKLGHGVYEILR